MKRKYIKIGVVLLLVIIILVGSFIGAKYFSKEDIINEEIAYIDIEETTITTTKEPNNFYIDIKGEVKHPGVYLVSEGMIVQDAIELAGGLTSKSYTANINLSLKLEKEMVIIIYNKYKITTTSTTQPKIKNDAEIPSNTSNDNKTLDGKVNINTASLEELILIPNIGESKANSIIEYRKSTPFNTIEDLMNVSGIGQSLYDKVKDYITV